MDRRGRSIAQLVDFVHVTFKHPNMIILQYKTNETHTRPTLPALGIFMLMLPLTPLSLKCYTGWNFSKSHLIPKCIWICNNQLSNLPIPLSREERSSESNCWVCNFFAERFWVTALLWAPSSRKLELVNLYYYLWCVLKCWSLSMMSCVK